ncbi:MAG TPA: DUF4439 domain-containing protein [Actinotalea sp.]
MRRAGTSRANRTTRSRLVAAVLALLTTLLVASCGLRLETPAPPALVPDEIEQVRQRTVADAVAVQTLADQAAATLTEGPLLAALSTVAEASAAHLALLGGVYDPGTTPTPQASGPPTASPGAPTASTAPAVTPQDVVALLVKASAGARSDASAVADGRLARILCSVAVSRALLAEGLAAAAGVAPPDVPDSAFVVPVAVPAGLTSTDVAALVQSEDALGLAWEITAARAQGDPRASEAARALEHRSRGELWARAADLDGTALDPRRSSYDLPPVLTASASEPAAVLAELAALEGDLAVDYVSLVAAVDAGSRSELVDAALDATREQARLGGAPGNTPGLPERS